MITEDYVSFETAKLLKEKGFDSDEVGCNGGFYSERCYESGHGIKTQSGQEVGIVYDDLTNSDLDYDEYLRPTIQMAMKWLREEHNLNVCFRPVKFPSKVEWRAYIFNKDCEPLPINAICGKAYEEACEAAVKYCLKNLI